MSNSGMVSIVKLSNHHSGPRTHVIDRITPHCTVGEWDAATICGIFMRPNTMASCNYCVGVHGDIGMSVEEKNRSWCSSSNANDQRAVTIECASKRTAPYEMNMEVYGALIRLCVDICKRNHKNKLLWFADKNKSLSYEPKQDEMVLTVHRWFANKSCPGDWLYNRLGAVAKEVTEQLKGNTGIGTIGGGKGMYKVQVGAFNNKQNAINMVAKLKAMGISACVVSDGKNVVVEKPVPRKSATEIAKEVIQGKWGNGTERKANIEKAGYNYSEVQKVVNRLL